MIASDSLHCIYKDEENSINNSRTVRKSSRVYHNQRNNKSYVFDELDCLLSLVAKGKSSKKPSVDECCDSQKEP